jgi:general secretion pathway protein L
MAVLVIQIPPRPRLGSRAAGEPAAAARPAAEYDYLLSNDGRSVQSLGRAPAAALPKADSVVAVLADADVSWHRVTIPRAPPARLRAALSGLMEEALLDDDEALHLALPPQAAAGQPAWVAVLHKPWLAATLAALESAGQGVDRVLPASTPTASGTSGTSGTSGQTGPAASGHFFNDGPADAAPTLALVSAEGAAVVRAGGSLARALLPPEGTPVRWTATPAAAAAAERWLGTPVGVLTEPERALEALRSPWNLRQFDLAPRHRGTLALRDAWRRFQSREWRPVRWGLAGLVAVQLLGLNLWAWHQQKAIEGKRLAMTALLREAHPGVRAIIDPPAQMQRETEMLRAAAGRPGEGDLEVLLGAAAAAWPDGQGPVQTLRFEGGRLTLAAPGWGEPQLAQFRERLRPAGYAADMAEGRVTLGRGVRKVL